MKNVMGVIYTGENDANLRELTLTRAIATLRPSFFPCRSHSR